VNAAALKLSYGLRLHKAGLLAGAEGAYREALEADPDNAEARYLLGSLALQAGRPDEAVDHLSRAAADGAGADCLARLGEALAAAGRNAEARVAYERAIAIKPDYAAAHNNLGVALKHLDRTDDAVAAFDRALAADDTFTEAHYNRASLLKGLGRLEEAVRGFETAIALDSHYAQAHNNLGDVLQIQGRVEEAVAAYRRAIEERPVFPKAHGNLLLCLNYRDGVTGRELYDEARRWSAVHAAPVAAARAAPANDPDPARRLRVGYVSPDFRDHPVSRFFAPLLDAHDRAAFEIVCYADVGRPDDVTRRLRQGADQWRETPGLSDEALADRVCRDRIDILVDLAGHTARGRLRVFARKPAPVQITWLGYGSTTGLGEMDYRFTDAIADPAGEADRVHSETLLRLPGGFLCYGPPPDAPDVAPPPATSRGHVTFGSFSNLAKVTPRVVALWADVLTRVADSRLILKSRALVDDATARRYRDLFADRGIAPGRIDFLPWIESEAGHLGAYGEIDIALDPFPYNGTTTTCEALWMGVPVVSLGGEWHQTRVGASLLHRVGLDGLAVGTTAAYGDAAARLAGDVDRLVALRARLRQTMADSPLCDAARFAHAVEEAYRGAWRKWCADHGA